jgi:hypothetical protein
VRIMGRSLQPSGRARKIEAASGNRERRSV